MDSVRGSAGLTSRGARIHGAMMATRIAAVCMWMTAFTMALTTVQAAAPTTAEVPKPQEWTRSEQLVEFLTELHFTGANHADLPPLDHTGKQMIGRIAGGTATGSALSGKILPIGEDWGVLRPDGTLDIDVRMVVQTDDGAFVRIQYKGLWRGTPETRKKILAGQDVDPKEYYLRMTPYFSTTSKKYDWLNHVVAVGYGYVQRGAGVKVRIFAMK